MNGKSMAGRLRRGAAAFGAAAILAGALAPAAALAADPYVDPGRSVSDKAAAGTATSNTEVWLDYTDKGAFSMSVTAPLRLHLAAQGESSDAAGTVYEFAVPSSEAARIVNNGSTKVYLAKYAVSSAGASGRKKVTDNVDAEGEDSTAPNGFFKKGTAAESMTLDKANEAGQAALSKMSPTDNTYWLQARVSGRTTDPKEDLRLELAVSNDDLDSVKDELTMGPNDESGSAPGSYLPLELSGMIRTPDKNTVKGFAAEGGAKLSTITWTFKTAS